MHRFDAALVDLRLSDMEGTELLPIIEKKSPETVKIVFSGSLTLDDERSKNFIDAFLVKPVKPEVLINLLDEKLASK